MKEEIIIDIQINEVADKLIATTKEIDRLKASNEELTKRIKNGEDAQGKYAKRLQENKIDIKDLTSTAKGYENQILNEIKANKANEGSLVQLRAQLSNMTKAYDNLSQAERQGAKGKELLSKIQLTTENLRLAEEESGRFQRSVGNYPQVFDLAGTSIGRLQGVISQFSKGATSAGQVAGNAFGAIKAQAISLGKAFLTPPIGLIVVVLSAIMLAVKKVSEAFAKNDEASTKLEKAFAALAPIGEAVAWVFDKIALRISKIIEGFAKGFTMAVKFAEALGLLPDGYSDAAKSAQDLVQSQDDLEQAERDYTVNSAKRNRQIADLQAKSLKESEYTAEQRKKFLEDAMDLEKLDAQENVKIQKQKLDNLKKLAAQNKDTSDKTMDAIAQQEAAVENAAAAEDEGNRRRISKIETFNREILAKEKEKQDKLKKMNEDSLKIAQELQELVIKNIKEGVDEEIALEKLKTERKIAELKKQTGLTKQGIADKNKLIEQLQIESDAKIKELEEKASDEKLKKDFEAEEKRLKILVDGAKKGSDAEYDLKVKNLSVLRKKELSEKNLTEEEKKAITEKYNQLEIDLEAEKIIAKNEAVKKAILVDFEQQKLDAFNNQTELANIELDAAIAESDSLISLDEKTKSALYKTQEDYELAVIASKERIKNAEKAVQEVSLATSTTQLDAISKIADASLGFFQMIADDNSQMNGFMKSLAASTIAISSASAIATAIATAAKEKSAVSILAAIAATISAVTSGISKAKSAFSDAKDVKSPNFKAADGLVVPGTSYTGDKIPVMTNSGEEILTMKDRYSVANLIRNYPTSGGIDYSKLAEAMANIRPQVDVNEINSVNSRVEILESLGKY